MISSRLAVRALLYASFPCLLSCYKVLSVKVKLRYTEVSGRRVQSIEGIPAFAGMTKIIGVRKTIWRDGNRLEGRKPLGRREPFGGTGTAWNEGTCWTILSDNRLLNYL